MVYGDKSRLWLKKTLLCIAFIILIGGLFVGCGDPEAVNLIEQEKDLSYNEADDTAEVLIQDTDGNAHVQIYFEEISLSFYYPSLLAEGISVQTIDAIDDGSWVDYPEYKLTTFDDYLLSDTAFQAHIRLTPIEEFFLLCDWAEQEINKLDAVIAKKNIPDSMGGPHYLPEPNAGQLFYANVEFFESETISGLRYLTQFDQGTSPLIKNSELTYIYQGITSNQKYYFTAAFPVNLSELLRHNEEYLESTGADYTDWDSWREVYDDYLDVTVQMLDVTDGEDFEPSLLLLDEIIKSFQIE